MRMMGTVQTNALHRSFSLHVYGLLQVLESNQEYHSYVQSLACNNAFLCKSFLVNLKTPYKHIIRTEKEYAKKPQRSLKIEREIFFEVQISIL